MRKKPRPTSTNKQHLNTVWGQSAKARIDIPGMIDDYNHYMGGVDIADQLISYYRSNLRCRRTWMPLMLHCFDIIRVNSYIAVKSRNEKMEHKSFIKHFIHALNSRAVSIERGARRETRQSQPSDTSPPGSGTKEKRRRMSAEAPSLPNIRFSEPKSDHVVAIGNAQRRCIYCSYLSALAQQDPAIEPPKVRIVKRYCIRCNVNLCNDHFSSFHSEEV
jgi:hypothetical protein